ncbi:MAG: pentapeptide repeat-containing protein [Patescibacteria group bacterium]|jgi:uncharacterized protein YjbI with pentapeptide repeats
MLKTTQYELNQIISRHTNQMPADLSNRDLSGLNFNRAKIPGANFEGSDLRRANMYNCDISKANMNNTLMYGINMWYANAKEVSLNNANLNYVKLNEVNLEGFTGIDVKLKNTSFENCDLDNGTLKADLRDIVLNRNNSAANLTLAGSTISSADVASGIFKALDVNDKDVKHAESTRNNILDIIKNEIHEFKQGRPSPTTGKVISPEYIKEFILNIEAKHSNRYESSGYNDLNNISNGDYLEAKEHRDLNSNRAEQRGIAYEFTTEEKITAEKLLNHVKELVKDLPDKQDKWYAERVNGKTQYFRSKDEAKAYKAEHEPKERLLTREEIMAGLNAARMRKLGANLRPIPEDIAIAIKEHRLWLNSKETQGKQLELKNIDLRNTDLSKINFFSAKIIDCDLSGCKLDSTNFRKADVSGTKFIKSMGINCDFTDTKMININASMSNFSNSVFRNAIIPKGDFTQSKLTNCNFKHVQATGIDFSFSAIDKVEFNKASLPYMKFENTNVRESVFNQASMEYGTTESSNFKDSKFIETNMSNNQILESNYEYCKMTEINMRYGDYEKSSFVNCEFINAKIDEVNLNEISFIDSNFEKASFYNTSLDKTELTGSNIEGINLTNNFERETEPSLTNRTLDNFRLNNDKNIIDQPELIQNTINIADEKNQAMIEQMKEIDNNKADLKMFKAFVNVYNNQETALTAEGEAERVSRLTVYKQRVLDTETKIKQAREKITTLQTEISQLPTFEITKTPDKEIQNSKLHLVEKNQTIKTIEKTQTKLENTKSKEEKQLSTTTKTVTKKTKGMER